MKRLIFGDGKVSKIIRSDKDVVIKREQCDIRDLDTCRKATNGCSYVFHNAALGSVPRSIKDPAATNAVNINGFLNMLIAAKDEKINRFIYAASSSAYGDSKELPKIEHRTGSTIQRSKYRNDRSTFCE